MRKVITYEDLLTAEDRQVQRLIAQGRLGARVVDPVTYAQAAAWADKALESGEFDQIFDFKMRAANDQ